eukprot:scaffold105678_cov32-Tisochrysis_lutea.AAC.6
MSDVRCRSVRLTGVSLMWGVISWEAGHASRCTGKCANGCFDSTGLLGVVALTLRCFIIIGLSMRAEAPQRTHRAHSRALSLPTTLHGAFMAWICADISERSMFPNCSLDLRRHLAARCSTTGVIEPCNQIGVFRFPSLCCSLHHVQRIPFPICYRNEWPVQSN